MSLRIRQIVVAARDLETTVSHFKNVFSVEVAYRDPLVAEFGLHNALMPIGDQFLEVVSPTRDGTTAGRLLERRGNTGYMLILQTDDFDRDRARLERLGVRVVWQAAFADMRAAHLHPKDIGGAIVSLDQPNPPASWRWAGPDWKKYIAGDGARHISGVEIETRDPAGVAKRWAEVLSLDGPDEADGGWRLALENGGLRFVEAGPRGDGISAFTVAVKRAHAAVAAGQSLGVPTTDQAVTLCGTRFDLVVAT